jgi:hypothetical protein
MRRRSGVFWWVALALGAGLIGYLLFGRGIALGAALKLLPATAQPLPAPKSDCADLVDVSVFGPTAIRAGGEGLVQVFLHTLGQREIAKALARETDPDATRRGAQTLATEIAQGQRVEILLEGRGLRVDQEMQEIDRCDVFYLFCSSRAKESEWVRKETEYALARRAASENGDPDIVPVLIEGPPPPAPPDSLSDIHFNDALIYVLAGHRGPAQ